MKGEFARVGGPLAVGALLTMGAVSGRAAGETTTAAPPAVEVRADRSDGLYRTNETIRFQVAFRREGRPVAGQRVTYRIAGDGGLLQTGSVVTAEQPVEIATQSGRPGILSCKVTAEAEGRVLTGEWGAGVDVFSIEPGMPRPEDFDAFWREVRAELDAVPVELLEQVAVPIPGYVSSRDYFEKKGVRLYDVKIACAGGMPVSGYLALPATMTAGACPGSVTFMGAPGHLALVWAPISTAAAGGIGLVINAHGHENGRDEAYIAAFRKTMGPWFGDDPRKVYIRGMALRAMRALQYIKSLPEWNGRDLTVGGPSMGGGQALLAASLDPDVSFCDAGAPTFCDWAGSLKRQRSGWPGALTRPEQIRAAAYYDLANLCTQIRAPTIIRTGFIDPLCAATGHFAIYNRMTCPKLILHNPGSGHNVTLLDPENDRRRIEAFKREHAGKPKGVDK